MATLPFMLIGIWICNILKNHFDNKAKECAELLKIGRNTGKVNKSKYRMKNVDLEDDELFLTDNGNFDEAFKL